MEIGRRSAVAKGGFSRFLRRSTSSSEPVELERRPPTTLIRPLPRPIAGADATPMRVASVDKRVPPDSVAESKKDVSASEGVARTSERRLAPSYVWRSQVNRNSIMDKVF